MLQNGGEIGSVLRMCACVHACVRACVYGRVQYGYVVYTFSGGQEPEQVEAVQVLAETKIFWGALVVRGKCILVPGSGGWEQRRHRLVEEYADLWSGSTPGDPWATV